MLRERGIGTTHLISVGIVTLIVGKVILIAVAISLVNRFPDKPLIYNIFWKTLL